MLLIVLNMKVEFCVLTAEQVGASLLLLPILLCSPSLCWLHSSLYAVVCIVNGRDEDLIWNCVSILLSHYYTYKRLRNL
jgi:hypothetical protein